MAKAFEQYGIGWFEKPVLADDIEGITTVVKAIDIPVATSEHEYAKYGFRDLIARGGTDIVQPDMRQVDGVTKWMKADHLAHAFNLPVVPHSFQLVHLYLTCATPNLKVAEYLGRHEEADKIIHKEWPQPVDRMWSPNPKKPGLGLELHPGAVEKCTTLLGIQGCMHTGIPTPSTLCDAS